MKHLAHVPTQLAHLVAPPAGAWIETARLRLGSALWVVAPPAGAWIETLDIVVDDETE